MLPKAFTLCKKQKNALELTLKGVFYRRARIAVWLYSTVTDLARFRGLSTSVPLTKAAW